MSNDQDLPTLQRALAACGPVATAILMRQAQRLTEGAERYGDDFDDGRDWLLELINELSDAENYADRIGVLGPLPPRLAVVRSLLSQAHRLAQAEYSERQRATRETIPEAAE
jgi:hypothetical protein